MNNERYMRMVQYKASLDHLYSTIDTLNPYDSSYQKTLSEAKIAGFKVLRNSRGEHRLEDKYPNTNNDFFNVFADAFRGHEY